jgi:hypothetical protein
VNAGRPSILTPDIHRAIVAGVRAGGYDSIAAQAAGVSRSTFRRWIKLGETRSARQPYKRFAADVREARAQARLSAEVEVRRALPFNWLRFGPGREREDEPGWSESRETKHLGPTDVLHSDEWSRIASAIDEALRPFPEARLAVAAAMTRIAAPEGSSS